MCLPDKKAKEGDRTSFEFNPQFFWVQYDKYSERDDSETPNLMGTTYDVQHEIAVKARDKERRIEIYPGHEEKKEPWCYRYVESMNFVGEICGDNEFAGTACALRFQGGEHRTGKSFISATTQRRMMIPGPEEIDDPVRVHCPLFAQRWTFTPEWRDLGPKKKWWGLDFAPAEQPQIDDDNFEHCGEAHLEYKRLHDADVLRIDATEDSDSELHEVTETAEKFE